ncbi:mitochondrial 37S ribosomal protein mS42 [Thermochaetoides thermophila DSM 1495]|uniref:Putative 37S ribosomal protein n=1 Tax=Chaetomium thermophilum (strain DSM 1495 / CBS 144.50 / IMI 039719) TaxID=759272 RepID=G0SGM5_CHATD|nr:putative 37S ribosomal protein [Thermochaetoides thermophila DSM 1495]EGS17364.1 putative 37S ribosomal protein [Thermochaetoides thermophila DSM 1495]
MIRPRLRISSAARPRLAVPIQAARPSFAQQIRSRHTLQPLPYEEKFNTAENGIPNFLSGPAFNIAWTQYQTHLIEKLNTMIADTDFEARQVKDILLMTAREPSQAPLFNYASMIHNNAFFFKHLSPEPVAMPEHLKLHLEQSFGSIETLRREMVYTAAAMFAPGFVWLVKSPQLGLPHAFRILTTYAAGSPYPAAHWRRQPVDMNTAAGMNDEQGLATAQGYIENAAFGAGKSNPAVASKLKFAPGGTDVQPVLCINTWEHVWLWDYGFGAGGQGGKLAYAEAWWNAINWEMVANEANIKRHQMTGTL